MAKAKYDVPVPQPADLSSLPKALLAKVEIGPYGVYATGDGLYQVCTGPRENVRATRMDLRLAGEVAAAFNTNGLRQ